MTNCECPAKLLHSRDHYFALTQTYSFGAGVTSAFVFLSTAIAWILTVQLSRMAHEVSDYSAMNAIVHWHLGAKTPQGGEVVDAVIYFFGLLTAIACSSYLNSTVLTCDVC